MKIRTSLIMLGLALAITAPVVTGTLAYAQSSTASANLQNQSFFNKKYRLTGSWSLVQRGNKTFVKFSDDFKTKNGPDLKVFLSPRSAGEVNGRNAVAGSLKLGVLKNNKGTQEYEIPAGTDLSKYSTILVHCEAFSVLWGGGAL